MGPGQGAGQPLGAHQGSEARSTPWQQQHPHPSNTATAAAAVPQPRPPSCCVCYWGCGTTGNIVVWVCYALLTCLGIGLAAGGGIDGRDCFKFFQDCQNSKFGPFSISECQSAGNKRCNLSMYQGLVASGVILVFLIAPLLFSYFSCCAKRPGGNKPLQGTPMAVVSHPVARPQQSGYYPPGPPGQNPPGQNPPAQYPPGQFGPPIMAYPPPHGAYPPVPAAYHAYPPAADPSNPSFNATPTASVSLAPAEPPKHV